MGKWPMIPSMKSLKSEFSKFSEILFAFIPNFGGESGKM